MTSELPLLVCAGSIQRVLSTSRLCASSPQQRRAEERTLRRGFLAKATRKWAGTFVQPLRSWRRSLGRRVRFVIIGAIVWAASSADGAESTWHLVTPMRDPRWLHAAGVGSDGKIYVYGGYVPTARNLREYASASARS